MPEENQELREVVSPRSQSQFSERAVLPTRQDDDRESALYSLPPSQNNLQFLL